MSNTTDIGMFLTIFCVFIIIGVILPFVQDEFHEDLTVTGKANIQQLDDDLSQNLADDITITNAVPTGLAVVGSIFKMFFWTFGLLPAWLDLFFTILRMMFFVLWAKILRGA